jgi:hypothetical protein
VLVGQLGYIYFVARDDKTKLKPGKKKETDSEHEARSQTHLDLDGETQIIESNLCTPKLTKRTSSIF